ncbi:MAG TPA: hypothetical protein VGB16_06470 [candidate division Zixibacteria bacterium]
MTRILQDSLYFQFAGEIDKKVYSDILVSPDRNAVVFRSIVKKMT